MFLVSVVSRNHHTCKIATIASHSEVCVDGWKVENILIYQTNKRIPVYLPNRPNKIDLPFHLPTNLLANPAHLILQRTVAGEQFDTAYGSTGNSSSPAHRSTSRCIPSDKCVHMATYGDHPAPADLCKSHIAAQRRPRPSLSRAPSNPSCRPCHRRSTGAAGLGPVGGPLRPGVDGHGRRIGCDLWEVLLGYYRIGGISGG
jgi:hypothetical protein